MPRRDACRFYAGIPTENSEQPGRFQPVNLPITLLSGVNMPEITAKPRILIADDERVIADTLAAILNQGGFEARAVYTTAKALEEAPHFKPDLLITDVMMTGLDGIEAAIRMKALLPDLHVFLLSGQPATAELLDRYNGAGYGFEILAKPVHPRDLLIRLRERLAA